MKGEASPEWKNVFNFTTDHCLTHLGRTVTARSYDGRVVTMWVTSTLHEKWPNILS